MVCILHLLARQIVSTQEYRRGIVKHKTNPNENVITMRVLLVEVKKGTNKKNVFFTFFFVSFAQNQNAFPFKTTRQITKQIKTLKTNRNIAIYPSVLLDIKRHMNSYTHKHVFCALASLLPSFVGCGRGCYVYLTKYHILCHSFIMIFYRFSFWNMYKEMANLWRIANGFRSMISSRDEITN